jgi:hypothetical protein
MPPRLGPSVWKDIGNGEWELSTPNGRAPVIISVYPNSRDRLVSITDAVKILQHLGYEPQNAGTDPQWSRGFIICLAAARPTPHNRLRRRIVVGAIRRAAGLRVDIRMIRAATQ